MELLIVARAVAGMGGGGYAIVFAAVLEPFAEKC